MRTMMRVSMETGAGNAGIKSGSLPELIQSFIKRNKPEASYFTADGGKRTAYFFLDLKDASQIPGLAEPWFIGVNASVEFLPAMNADDLAKGIEAASKALK